MIEAQHRRAARSPYDLELAGVRKMPERNRLEARLEASEARQSVTDPVPVRSERPRVVDPMSPRMARVVAGRADGQPSSPPALWHQGCRDLEEQAKSERMPYVTVRVPDLGNRSSRLNLAAKSRCLAPDQIPKPVAESTRGTVQFRRDPHFLHGAFGRPPEVGRAELDGSAGFRQRPGRNDLDANAATFASSPIATGRSSSLVNDGPPHRARCAPDLDGGPPCRRFKPPHQEPRTGNLDQARQRTGDSEIKSLQRFFRDQQLDVDVACPPTNEVRRQAPILYVPVFKPSA